MKKNILFGFLGLLLLGCDDGDIQIETIDFDSITTINNCEDTTAGVSNVLFKINGDEALILTLPASAIKNEVSEISSTIPSESDLKYRFFSDDVTTSYFCDAIPATTPTVLDEIDAEGGEVYITTTTTDSITYTHVIKLSAVSFITSENNRITDLEVDNYGTITTTVEE